MLIARLVPENNIEMAIKAYMESCSKELLVIVGNYESPYGQKMRELAEGDSRIIFQGEYMTRSN